MMTPQGTIQQQIDNLRTQLLVMGEQTRRALNDACLSVLSKDTALAGAVIDGDSAINSLENEIDAASLDILARNQPVARDLRLVMSAVRMVVELERIGDESVVIAERALLTDSPVIPEIRNDFTRLMDHARETLDMSLDAFRDENLELAFRVCSDTEETSQTLVSIYTALMTGVKAGSIDPWDSMHSILSTRALDRICKRAENIAEHTCFMIEGVTLKHSRDRQESGKKIGRQSW